MSIAATMPTRHAPSVPDGPVVSNLTLAMAAVIAGEVMLFAGLIGAYLVFRLQGTEWPPPGLPRLPIALTAANTLVLLASVPPMRAAWRHVRHDRLHDASRGALRAAALGLAFLLVQGVEWVRLVRHGLTLQGSGYGGAFYVLIGCHALHVAAAVLLLLVVNVLIRCGLVSSHRHGVLQACAVYWYFVAGLWLVLFPLVYLY